MKRPAVLAAALLIAVCAALIAYRVIRLEYPILPAASVKVWQLSVEGLIGPLEKGITFKMGLPTSGGGRTVAEERITSGGLNFNLVREGANQIGIWSGDSGPAGALIGYRATVLVRPMRSLKVKPMELGPYPAGLRPNDLDLVHRLAGRWAGRSVLEKIYEISAAASGNWGENPPEGKELKDWARLTKEYGSSAALLALLRAAELPARAVQGVILAESVTEIPISWIGVWTGQYWAHVNPETGFAYDRSISFLPLIIGDIPPVQISRGDLPRIRLTVNQQVVSQWRIYFDRIRQAGGLLNRWSLFSLPPEFQATFRILLLVPIGALLVCVLRNMIGFPTFGIFMPVLMALAFRNTGLGYGLAIFCGVILIGYVIRLVLDKLKLLLVPRLSVILTVVIGAFTFLAVAGNKLGIRELMAVGLLPFVILTMMIERFFVIVEEAGVREGVKNAVGSAAVAAITHLIIHIEPLQLTFFVYPELLLLLIAMQILVGRYTGYRLSELIRFRNLRKTP